MTLVASPKVPDSQLTSCARLPEKTKYLCARESGDNQVGTAGLPEDVLDITTSLKEHHLKLLDSPNAFVPLFASFVHLKVAHGDRIPFCPKDKCKSSIFFGNRKTTISIKEYVKRIALHSKCSPICFIGAYVYLQRLNQVSSEHRMCGQSIHRLLIASVLIAAKLMDDKFYSNSYYARVGGISIKELNLLELEMLKALEFRAHISHEELSDVLSLLTSSEAYERATERLRQSKKRGNEMDQSGNEDVSLPAKLQHDSKSHQVLVTAGEGFSSVGPPSCKASTAVAGLSCRFQDKSGSSLDGKSLPVHCVVSAGGT